MGDYLLSKGSGYCCGCCEGFVAVDVLWNYHIGSEGDGRRAVEQVMEQWMFCGFLTVRALSYLRLNDFPAGFVSQPESVYYDFQVPGHAARHGIWVKVGNSFIPFCGKGAVFYPVIGPKMHLFLYFR